MQEKWNNYNIDLELKQYCKNEGYSYEYLQTEVMQQDKNTFLKIIKKVSKLLNKGNQKCCNTNNHFTRHPCLERGD